jgi:hypothetical protein
MKAFLTTFLVGAFAAGLLAGSVNAKPVVNKTYKPGAATRYTKGGEAGTVIGPKVKPVARHRWGSINPQPEPPGRR